MLNLINFINQAKNTIEKSENINTLNSIRILYFGKNGYFSKEIKILQKIPKKEKPQIGKIINKAKKEIQKLLINHKLLLEKKKINELIKSETLDISLPGRRIENGNLHPISNTIERIENIFNKLGFIINSGSEIEDNYHNFDALNIPNDHPTRNKNNTFWFDKNKLLRTQTSSTQIHIMKKQKPPIRMISSGKVYRKDYDQTHTPMFHQTEGLVIDINISFTNLKDMLYNFLENFFEKKIKIRFRPSYFPFTKLSAEIDILNENGEWLEILGCGMVHPKIFYNTNINPNIYSGFSFGIGIERLTMLLYEIKDLRMFFKNDIRFLKQFK